MAKKILFINQEIVPYVPDSDLSLMGKALPQAILEKGHEIRTFMPKWGNINERRGQLHEVIRLSGMNLIKSGRRTLSRAVPRRMDRICDGDRRRLFRGACLRP